MQYERDGKPTSTHTSASDSDHQPQGSQPEDGVTRGMHAFFDCYAKFTRVAKTRGIMEKGERLALFTVYTGRME